MTTASSVGPFQKLTWTEPWFFHLRLRGRRAWEIRLTLWAALAAAYAITDAALALKMHNEPRMIAVRVALVTSLIGILIFGPHTLCYVEVAPTGIRSIPLFYLIYGPIGLLSLLVYAVPMPRPQSATIATLQGTKGAALVLSFKYGKPKLIGVAKEVSLPDLESALTQLGIAVEFTTVN